MRPLYQEVILPNLCYIGGGGEIAYWLELKSFLRCKSYFPYSITAKLSAIGNRKTIKKSR